MPVKKCCNFSEYQNVDINRWFYNIFAFHSVLIMTTFSVSHLPFFTSFTFSFVHVSTCTKEMENQTTRTQGQYMCLQVLLPILVNPERDFNSAHLLKQENKPFPPLPISYFDLASFAVHLCVDLYTTLRYNDWVRMANFNFWESW